jgi:hypothetical protein
MSPKAAPRQTEFAPWSRRVCRNRIPVCVLHGNAVEACVAHGGGTNKPWKMVSDSLNWAADARRANLRRWGGPKRVACRRGAVYLHLVLNRLTSGHPAIVIWKVRELAGRPQEQSP